MLALLFQGEPTISVSTATMIGIVAVAASIATSYIASTKASAKFQGEVIATFKAIRESADIRFEAHAEDIDDLKESDQRIWKEVNKNGNDIAEVKGRLGRLGRAHNG
jgi:hypothetical protein